jgi:FtsP/CotA-like multicopper oxidase with cupredoxin domain
VVPLNGNNEVRVFLRSRDMKVRYVMHCHNVVHGDHAMMIRWEIV